MIRTFVIGNTLVAFMPICSAGNRRQAERRSVDILVRHLFGERFTLGHDSDGAPILVFDEDHNGLTAPFVSVSHSRSTAVVAVDSRNPIGIDIEEWRKALIDVRQRFLTTEELKHFTAHDDMVRAWTVKEAVYKVARLKYLALTDIEIHGNKAFAAGRSFSIVSMALGEETLTLAREDKPCK